nr:Ig-like domain-containing protein [Luteibacter rhizovicinus]
MKDHLASPRFVTRYAALRARRRPLLLPAVTHPQGTDANLPPPIIHGIYNGGLRRDQLLGDFATVQVTVGPWDYADLSDTILLHWGDQWTQSFPVKDTNGAQLLSIPGVDIAGDPLGNGDHYSGEGTQTVWYEVRTVGGEHPPSSTQDVVVKTARPGGEDPRPDTPVNDNLGAPTANPDPVEEGTTGVTFSVSPWANITTDDKLTLVLGGYRFDFPAIANTITTQTLILTAEQIEAIDGGPQTPVTYEIVDRVGNRSGYAPYLLLDIWLEAGDRLEKIELFDDAKNPIEGAIDPTMIAGFARVPRYTGWKPGESVTVVLEGVDSNEQTHETTLGPLAWTASDYYLDFALAGSDLLVLAGGIVRVHYETSNGGISYRRLYVVDALPEMLLPEVIVIGEQAGELPLDAITGDYVSIVIPDSEALVDFSRVTLTMEGTGDIGPVREEETHNVGQGEGHTSYTFVWTKTQVSKLLDHPATFSYTIRTLDGTLAIHPSEPHDLLIRKTGAPGQLAPPVVLDLIDGAVSPTLPKLRLTVPAGTVSVAGATVVTTVAGRTTETRTDRIFDDGETLTVDFPGWPAVNDGDAKASYTIDGKPSREASFQVGVAQPFSIAETPMTLDIGDSQQRQPTGGTLPYGYVSLNTTAATVDADGVVTARAAGSSVITASDDANHAGSYDVTVRSAFAIDRTPMVLDIGDTRQREATGGTRPYRYASSATTVAVVDEFNGTVTARAAGPATVTASDDAGHSDFYNVSVNPSDVIELLAPVPDFVDFNGKIDIGRINASKGLRIVVKQFQGMAIGQTIELSVVTAFATSSLGRLKVAIIEDQEFFFPKSDIERLVAELQTPAAGFEYLVTSTGVHEPSPYTEVLFYIG